MKKILRRLFNLDNPMRLSHIIQRVYCEPMLITSKAHAAVRQVIESKLANEYANGLRTEDNENEDIFGEPLPVPYNLDEGIRVIPIYGVIGGPKVSRIEKTCGVVSTSDVAEWIELALADDTVNGIVLDIDSPGGVVTGVPELATLIRSASNEKQIISFTSGLMASAAYWLASASTQVFATPSSEIGSIGVYMYLLDVTKAYEEAGIKAELFVGEKAKYKGMGLPGIPLTDTQREYLQGQTDSLAKDFKAFVKERRGNVSDETMQGQTFNGNAAWAANLIDGTAYRISDLV